MKASPICVFNFFKIFTVAVVFFAFAKAESQTSDLFRTEYTYFPQRNSDNSFRRFRTMVQVPLKVSDGRYVIPSFEYRNVNLLIRDNLPFTEFESSRYQSFEGTIGYTYPLKNNWRFGGRAGAIISSDFVNNKVQNDDIFLVASAYWIKDVKAPASGKPWRLILGVDYSTTAGRPFPLPYVNYYKEVSPDWSFSVGVPKMNLKYNFNEHHNVQLFAALDGFFGNLQNDITTQNGVAENISMTTAMSGLGYEYNLTDNISLYSYAGYTIFNDIRLRDASRNDVRILNNDNTFYSRVGVKFKI